MQEGFEYLLQFPRAARGIRAANGEYLDRVDGVTYRFDKWEDPDPNSPPRVIAIDHAPTVAWDGSPLTLEINGALDPLTVAAWIEANGTVVPTLVRLTQQYSCDEPLSSFIQIEPETPLPAGAALRIVVPGTVKRLGGTTGVTGGAPSPEGAGFALAMLAK